MPADRTDAPNDGFNPETQHRLGETQADKTGTRGNQSPSHSPYHDTAKIRDLSRLPQSTPVCAFDALALFQQEDVLQAGPDRAFRGVIYEAEAFGQVLPYPARRVIDTVGVRAGQTSRLDNQEPVTEAPLLFWDQFL